MRFWVIKTFLTVTLTSIQSFFIFYLWPYCQFSLLNILCLIGKPQYIIQNLLSASVLEKSSSGHQESKFSIEYDYLANIFDAGVANSL